MTKMSFLHDFSPVIAQTPVQPSTGSGSMITQLMFLGLMFAAMYFLLIAPQRKKQKEHDKMLAALTTGDEIVTTGGIFGVITNVKDDRFVVRISDNTKVEIGKGFVHGLSKQSTDEKK
jgi:preprotein translocase subunit YajC